MLSLHIRGKFSSNASNLDLFYRSIRSGTVFETLFEVPDEEISQKKFTSRLVASGGVLEGYVRIAVLPDQSG